MRRVLACLLCAALLCGLFAGCGAEAPAVGVVPAPLAAGAAPEQLSAEAYALRAAVLHAGGEGWTETLDYLSQSTLLNLSAVAVDATAVPELDGYDVLYLDESLAGAAPVGLAEAIMAYTEAGGAVLVPNALYDWFPAAYLGAASFRKVEGCCDALVFPALGADLSALRQPVADFAALYPDYAAYETLAALDYGWGMVPDGAVSLAEFDGLSVYTVNDYGAGKVFFTNPLLPNRYSPGSFDMTAGAEAAASFASTTASLNRALLDAFAAYAAKQVYGYALERVYGYFGSPSMSWELHYEELTGIAHGSLQLFSQLCEQVQQIPSFTLIRNSYEWFLRAESVTYLLNRAQDGYTFEMDFNESAYSSGTHIDSGGQWLSLARTENAGSYFLDYPEYTCRACPAALDYDGDGATDLFCGSQDGQLYYYRGLGFDDGRLRVSEAAALCDESGAPLSCGSYSAPQLIDLDGDGLLDLVCGGGDGLVRWYRGDGALGFTAMGTLIDTDIPGQVLPAFGDADGDGVTDLAVGSDQGILLLYYGSRGADGALRYSHGDAAALSRLCADAALGDWLAPAFVDWDGDGTNDLAVGVYQGYVAKLRGGDGYVFDGYLTGSELNYKGNANLKFGNFCAPQFCDLDGDGAADLLCGSQEYGLAYPIDSAYFPYAAELAEQMQYARDHDYYVGVHFYTNAYASAVRELYELAAHRAAMAAYGLDTAAAGANQHTWYTSSLSGAQTMSDLWSAGLLWQSGFGSPGAGYSIPQSAAENVIATPFYLTEAGAQTLLVQNNSVLPYTGDGYYARTTRYGAPVCIYYHCDFVYADDAPMRAALAEVSDFQWTYGYNFNREDQLMLASAAAAHQSVRTGGGLLEAAGLTLTPEAADTDFALYDAAAAASLGVRVCLTEGLDAAEFAVDADLWFRDGSTLVLGLNRPVTLTRTGGSDGGPHLRQVNMAAELSADADGAQVRFLSGGMMQAVVEGAAATDDPGWTVTERDGRTVFTRYGGEKTLQIRFLKEN